MVLIKAPGGGSWDLATTYTWAYDPTYSGGNLYKVRRTIITRAISPVVSSYEVP